MKTTKKPHYSFQIFTGVFLIISMLSLFILKAVDQITLIPKIFGGIIVLIFFVSFLISFNKNFNLELEGEEK